MCISSKERDAPVSASLSFSVTTDEPREPNAVGDMMPPPATVRVVISLFEGTYSYIDLMFLHNRS